MFDKLVDLLIELLRSLRFCTVVRAYQRGVVLRFGRFHREIDPGYHWLIPVYIDEPIAVNVVPETMLIGPQSLTTKDGVSLVITTVVTFSIEDVRKFLLEIEGAHQVIEDSAFGIVARFIMGHTGPGARIDPAGGSWKARRRRQRNREGGPLVQAKKYGVAVINVQICDFTQSRSYRIHAGVAPQYPRILSNARNRQPSRNEGRKITARPT